MKALITASFHEEGIARLRPHLEICHEDYRETGKIYYMEEELIDRIRETGAEVLIVEADLVPEEVFAACPLRIVGCCRGDPLNVSREEASRRGIPILYAPGRNADAVADLTLGYMLDLARNITLTNLRIRRGKLDIQSPQELVRVFGAYGGFELGGILVGLVGFGAVGRKVAHRLQAFGARILVHDPYVPEEALRACGAEPASLEDLLRRADMVSLHCPDSEDTVGMIGEKQIALMKPAAFFLNTARSIVTDEKALLKALQEGRLQGAALDVFDEEPLQADNPFLQLDNVICTPHLGGAARDVVRRQSEMISGDVLRVLRGERPLNLWNPEVLAARGEGP